MSEKTIKDLRFDENGLIPAVIQDVHSGAVLTLCYMDREAFSRTLDEGRIYVYRRSKGRLMLKGESSGCTQQVRAVFVDCAGNSLLFKVEQERAACHKGYFSCYFRRMTDDGLFTPEGERLFDPEDVYGREERE